MNAKFTPGPWSRDKYGHVIDTKGESVLLRSVSIACSGMMVDEAEKNTDLIAAAPDLLEALIFCLDGLRTYAPEHMHGLQKDSYIRKASSAIAKATGEQP